MKNVAKQTEENHLVTLKLVQIWVQSEMMGSSISCAQVIASDISQLFLAGHKRNEQMNSWPLY